MAEPGEQRIAPGGTAPGCVVVVEIPKGGRTKFEVDPQDGTIWLDRVLSTATQYPADYGFVQGTLAPDGDALDALVLIEEPTVPTCHVHATPVGLLLMTDEQGPDPKLLCVATGDLLMADVRDIGDVAPHLLDEIEHFFRVYKQLEPAKTTTTFGWHDVNEAYRVLADGRARFAHAERHDKEVPVDIKLDAAQEELLRELLDHDLRDLRYEIADTDRSDFKRKLKAREQVLRAILDQVGGPLPDPPFAR
ncbi:MAG: inorganic diphosphatase [Acidimicrobiia bacterium]